MTDGATSLTYTLDDGIAIVTFDDGKANAITHAVLAELDAALDRALGDDARAVVIAGRDGRFSAGFDLATMAGASEGMQRLVMTGARIFARLYAYPLPTVAACTGHAVAGGAILLLSLDHRVGADAPVKIGLNEVSIGIGLPIFAVELARDRLAPHHLGPATMAARIYDPEGAVEAGYLDRVVASESVVAEAVGDARHLAELRTGAYVRTKQLVRGRTVDHILATLDADIASLAGPGS